MKKTQDKDLILDFIKGSISVFKSIFATFYIIFKKASFKKCGQETDLPENFRGKIEINPIKCTGCKTCEKLCPTFDALVFKNTKNSKKLAAIDFSKCISCGNCAYNCYAGAINITKQYKLATNDKKDLKLDTEAEWKP